MTKYVDLTEDDRFEIRTILNNWLCDVQYKDYATDEHAVKIKRISDKLFRRGEVNDE